MKKAYLDRYNYGVVYHFIPTPVWFTIEVEIDPDLEKAVSALNLRFSQLNEYMGALYEAARAGAPVPEMPDNVKEIIAQCLAPAAAAPAKKQKPKDTAAASS